MNLFKRFQGVVFSPKPTFQALAEKPVWVDVLILLLAALILFSFLTSSYSQSDRLGLMKDNVKLKERMGEERFNQMIAGLENPSQSRNIVQNAVVVPVFSLIGFLFSSLMLMIMSRFVSPQGRYVQVFAVLLHANIVDKILGNLLRVFLITTRKSVMQTSTGLAMLFPRLEITSPLYMILAQVDFFQLWLFALLGFGLASVLQVSVKKGLVISYAFWLLKSLIYIALSLIGMQYMR